jgi:hypothetical protein
VSPVTYVTTANTVYDVSNILASGVNPVFVDSLGVDKGLYVLVENWDSDNGFKTFGRIEHNGLYSYSTFWSVNVDGWENTSYVINDVQADWSAVAINSPAYIKNKPDLSQYQTTADMSGYLPNSASGDFYPMTGNPSSFLTAHQDISTKLDVTAFTSYSANLDSALGDEFDQIHSALDDKLDKTAFTGYTATALTGLENDVSSLSAAVSSLTGTYVEQSAFNDYSAGVDSALADKADASSMTSYMPYSSLGYSGTVITGIDGSAIAGQGGGVVTATASGEYYDYRSGWLGYYTGISGINNSALVSNFATISEYARYDCNQRELSSLATEEYVDSNVSGKADASALTAYQPTGDYAYNSSLSGKLDTTAQVVTSTSTGNYTMGGFITTGVSAINTKALLAVSAGSAQCDSLGRTITATYQPTGAYIYESALGWAEV